MNYNAGKSGSCFLLAVLVTGSASASPGEVGSQQKISDLLPF